MPSVIRERDSKRARESERECVRERGRIRGPTDTVTIVMFLQDHIADDQTVPLLLVWTVPAKEGFFDSKLGERSSVGLYKGLSSTFTAASSTS